MTASQSATNKGESVRGRIIKGVGGFYYVFVPDRGLYACRARGLFRKQKLKPLPGDQVELLITDEKDREGSISSILERKNSLIRPAAANIDQALVVFALKSPDPNFNLLDRYLLKMRKQGIKTLICFNKTDLVSRQEADRVSQIYRDCGSQVFFVCVKNGEGLEQVRRALSGKTTIIAGPSGAGKSSMTNTLYPDAGMETGSLSRKIQRGKNTTRHSQLFALGGDTYLMDTPGFSTIYLNDIEKDELAYLYPEFDSYYPDCRFKGCSHISEPDCAVKKAVEEGRISRQRYDNYCLFYEEIADRRPY